MTNTALAALIRSSVVGKALPQVNFGNDVADMLDRTDPTATVSSDPNDPMQWISYLTIMLTWGTF